MDTLTQLLMDLIAIDSVNPDLVAGAAGEGEIARFIAGWCTAAGLDVHLDEVRPGRPNVIAVARGTGGGRTQSDGTLGRTQSDGTLGRTLMLNGHVDTVGLAGMERGLQPTVDGDHVYGRGAFDMKGGLAALMMAAAEARKHTLRGDVVLTAVMDEELAGSGTMDVARRYRADGAIIAEPTEMNLVVAHKGFVWLDVETTGVAAHGSRPDLGVDAIAHMGRVLVELEALNRRLLASPTHPLLKSGSLHTSLIEGGREGSTYPERCVLSMERRTIPGETPERVEAEVNDILQRLSAADPTFRATARRTLDRAPLETPPDAPLVAVFQRAMTAVTGRPTTVAGMTGWTDAATLKEVGIPAVLLGPTGGGAHAAVEWADASSLRQCADIYLRAIDEFCG